AARLERVGHFASPVHVTAPPGDDRRLLVVEQAGVVRVVRGGRTLSRPFLDIRGSVLDGGERGLLSIAFAPDYERSRRLYVYFTDNRGDIRIQEFRRSRRSADRADRRTRRSVLRQTHRQFANHNGGQLQFGPDGLLYAALGDGGGSGDPFGRAQSLRTLLGKLIRIDPRRTRGGRPYRTPRSNPFYRRSGARRQIFALGLRNPFRFSFDRATGDLTIGDVGEGTQEEVDFVARAAGGGRGANFGWNHYEGDRLFPGGGPLSRAGTYVPPVLTYGHRGGACSIAGGYVVRDPGLPALAGRYVYGDFCTGELRSAVLRPGRATGDAPLGREVPRLSSFGEDARGRVYAASLAGDVYRLAPP
ncbi:MAG: PQQ-dependent sugar dehydrogenase, partial [Actinomycetota bacterium]|nr:PQQ-dependent sugar dehydrogenase [Actinomycetota bacterium]